MAFRWQSFGDNGVQAGLALCGESHTDAGLTCGDPIFEVFRKGTGRSERPWGIQGPSWP